MDSKANSSRSQTLSDICTDFFSLTLYLRESEDLDQIEALYQRFTSLFSTIEGKARDLDIPDVDIQDAQYALVALADETMRWTSRLEQEYFRKNIAGEEFFRRLEQIKESKGRKDVLEIYYLCLTLGFEGRYFRTPEKLEEYIEELGQILGLKGMEKLAPNGEPSEKAIQRRGFGIPSWIPWAFAGAGIVAVLVIFAVLRIRIGNWTTIVVSKIQSLIG